MPTPTKQKIEIYLLSNEWIKFDMNDRIIIDRSLEPGEKLKID